MYYAGQPTTCHRCGDLTHKIRDCKKQIGTGINVIELDPETINEIETENELNDEPSDEEAGEPINNDNQDEPLETPERVPPQPEASPPQPDPSPASETPNEKHVT